MPLDWTTEEKVLTDIKRIAAVVWRMNSDQMQSYRQKLQKNQLKILPGYLGNTFLKICRKDLVSPGKRYCTFAGFHSCK